MGGGKTLDLTAVSSLSLYHKGKPIMPMDNESLNRAKEIRERLVQLKDSL